MYNGIGLQTPRGSGTNGYVQKNASYIRPAHVRITKGVNRRELSSQEFDAPKQKKANLEILEHQKRRNIEAKIFELEESMKEKGYAQEEIDLKVQRFRKELESNGIDDSFVDPNKNDSHLIAVQKEQENERFRNAFGIGDDFVEGAAFDRELQEKKKIERKIKREEEMKRRELEREEKEKLKNEMEKRRESQKISHSNEDRAYKKDRDSDRNKDSERVDYNDSNRKKK